MKKLAIITTHPIQYYAPVFELLHDRGIIEIQVFYTLGDQRGEYMDSGFNRIVKWDIPLTSGYPFKMIPNTAKIAGTRHFNGIVNPTAIQIIKDWHPDALLVFGWANRSHLNIIRAFYKRLPIYFRGDSILGKVPFLKKKLRAIFLKWVYHHISHAFYVGTNNFNYFRKFGLSEEQLSFTPHAIDNRRFALDRRLEARELRQSLKLKDTDILVLYAGKFEPVKNLAVLVRAFAKLQNPFVHLLLVGNGIEQQALKKMAFSCSKQGQIHFIDFQNQMDIPVVYQAADLFCLPSLSETWGLAVNEAMASGKAVLVSDQAGCATDLVIPGNNGEIFDCTNPADLLEKLSELTLSKTRLKKLGENSAKLIKAYNFEQIARVIENKLINEEN